MKKLTGALVLSLSLLLASACRSSGETKEGDASTPSSTPASAEQNPSPAGAVDTTRNALSGDTSGTPSGTVPAPKGVNMGETKGDSGPGSEPGTATGSSKPADEGTLATLSEAERAAQENCLDAWLQGKKLDRYGHEEGTMYAGGSPLFNEATGESTDRLVYVYKRKPEAKQACANAGKTQKK